MNITVMLFLVIGALITAIAAAVGRCPLWVSVILLCIAMALTVLPLR